MMLTIKRRSLALDAFLFIVGFSFSFWLHPYYVGGDQEFYRQLYSELPYIVDLSDAYAFYRNTVGGIEPGYFAFARIFSPWVDKDLLFSLVNGVLFAVALSICRRQRIGGWIAPFLLVNLYYVSLSFSAERLKVALTLFLIAFLFNGWKRVAFVLLSVTFHLQIIILLASYALWHIVSVAWIKRNAFKLLLFGVVAAILAYFLLSGPLLAYLQSKNEAYQSAGWGGLQALAKPGIFLLLAAIGMRDRFKYFLSASPVLAAAFLFGSERVTIFAFLIFVASCGGGGWHKKSILLIFLLYYSFNGIQFIVDFVARGFSGV